MLKSNICKRVENSRPGRIAMRKRNRQAKFQRLSDRKTWRPTKSQAREARETRDNQENQENDIHSESMPEEVSKKAIELPEAQKTKNRSKNRTKWTTKPREAKYHTKISYGLILTQVNPKTRRVEAILERMRYSYEYSEFVYGRYNRNNTKMIAALLDGMTIDERLDIYSLNFRQMWYRIWLTADRWELYHKKLTKFQSSWMCNDGGKRLRQLLQRSGTALSSDKGVRWEIPKGRRQSNREPEINCAIREFGEEAQISKVEYRILPDIQRRISYLHMGVRYINVYFAAIARRALRPTVNLKVLDQAAEVAEVRWLDIEQIRLIDTSTGRLEKTLAPVFRYVKRYLRGSVSPRRSILPERARPANAFHFSSKLRDLGSKKDVVVGTSDQLRPKHTSKESLRKQSHARSDQ